jgi:hypothetical protein
LPPSFSVTPGPSYCLGSEGLALLLLLPLPLVADAGGASLSASSLWMPAAALRFLLPDERGGDAQLVEGRSCCCRGPCSAGLTWDGLGGLGAADEDRVRRLLGVSAAAAAVPTLLEGAAAATSAAVALVGPDGLADLCLKACRAWHMAHGRIHQHGDMATEVTAWGHPRCMRSLPARMTRRN